VERKAAGNWGDPQGQFFFGLPTELPAEICCPKCANSDDDSPQIWQFSKEFMMPAIFQSPIH
jgi:hypothetical protein